MRDNPVVKTIDLVMPWGNSLETLDQSLKDIKYFTIQTSYLNLLTLAQNSTIDQLFVFGEFVYDLVYDYEILLLQAILTKYEELDINTIDESLTLFIRAIEFGVPVIMDDEVFEYAYDNGISIYSNTDYTEQVFITEVLEPMGFIPIHNNHTLGGWVDFDTLLTVR